MVPISYPVQGEMVGEKSKMKTLQMTRNMIAQVIINQN